MIFSMEPCGKTTTKPKMNIVEIRRKATVASPQKSNERYIIFLEARSPHDGSKFDLIEIPRLFLQNESIIDNLTPQTEILLRGEHDFKISAFHYINLYARSTKQRPENIRLNIYERSGPPFGHIWVASVYHDRLQPL